MFGTIYNSIYFIAQAMNNAMKENGWASAASLVQHSRNMQFYGFNQLIRTDSNGNGISEYVILDTNWKNGNSIVPTLWTWKRSCYDSERPLFTFLVAGPLEQMHNAGLQMGRSAKEVRNGKSQVVNLAQLGLQGTCLGEGMF